MLLAYPRYITMMPRMRQALVEFENVEDALTCVQSCQVDICILDHKRFSLLNSCTSSSFTFPAE